MRISKLVAVVSILFLAVFMTTSAMAFQVTNRSAEMDDFSACDRAGTIKMNFTQSDVDQITAWLVDHDYAMIRIALNGTDLPTSPTLPKLCKDISGAATSDGALIDGNTIPFSGSLVALDEETIEISDLTVAGTPDATIFVYGKTGDQYLSVYITALNVTIGASADDSSWFKIGLNEELAGGDKTSICAQVLSFSGVSKLTISNEAFPNTLTFSGDNEIGHFLTQTFSVRDCVKDETCEEGSTTPVITLCPLGDDPQSPDCPSYYTCLVAEGDFVPGDLIKIMVRTNGAANGDDTQNGVFLKAISLADEDGEAIATLNSSGAPADWAFYKADGATGATLPCAAWEAEHAVAYIASDDIVDEGNELRFCVTYTVNPAMAVAGTNARIWVEGETVPCGQIFKGVRDAAALEVCPGEGGMTLLFPYFVSLADTDWWNGIAIANLSSNDGKATFTAYVNDGTTAVVTDVPVPANSIYVELLENMPWAGAHGNGQCYIYVTTDFQADGFGMMANEDNNDSMGYLPRLPSSYIK